MVLSSVSILKRRNIGLRIQVFVSGFAVMVLELVGSRFIAPVFGNSIFTWGSIIGVVMTGLAAGYHYGGKLADRSPSPRKFSSLIFTAGMLVVLLPFLVPYILGLSITLGLGDQYGPLLSSALILGPQTFVLGMVSPYAVKIGVQTLTSLGNVAGNLYSLSTVGSIIGVFAAAFVLIPMWDVRSIIFALGISLMLTSLIWLAKLPITITAVVIILLATPLNIPASQIFSYSGEVVYEKETPYSHLSVIDSGDRRILYLNGLPHSGMNLEDPNRLVFTYTRYFHIGLLANPDTKNVLFVGGGGFSGPKNFLATYPDVNVDVVEVDPDVIDAAKQYFEVKPDPRLTISNMDGRLFLTLNNKPYDLIILDAYAKTYVPFHLMTREFMQLLHARLTPQGAVVSNLIGSLTGDTSDLVRAEYKTIASVFPIVDLFTTSDLGPGAVQNLILVFRKNGQPLAESINDSMTTDDAVSGSLTIDDIRRLYPHPTPVEDVPLLTDNYAPVENLLNPVTGHPYELEQQVGRLAVSPPPTAGSYTLTFAILLLISTTWFMYLSINNRKV
ncbi:MAG: fused MFS/spermidine synthase [Thaumarchaeota archaeon]|nr:fused MFS/spermidine synthase [Nitrososphaerota archaeon]